MKVVLVLGAHRTGTKALAKYFQKHYADEVWSFHQFNRLRIVNILSNMYCAGILPEFVLKKAIDRVLVAHIESHSDRKVYFLSNGFNYLAARYIQDKYEDVSIVHMVRDVRSYIPSYINFIAGRWKSKIANTIVPYWQPGRKVVSSLGLIKWFKMSDELRFAYYWKYKNDFIRKEYSSSSYLKLRFEDIVEISKRQVTLNDIVKFIGLHGAANGVGFFDHKHNANTAVNPLSWQDLAVETRDSIIGLCEKEMALNDYN